ncbi:MULTISPECIES: TIGR02452 family protein [unclassified Thiocapsa]|uniref:TIGR02452 family protein n=1 Tax=unclassified Thiocapsa TaxID=2641286 RepID=UPI0035B3AB4E
MSRSESSHGLRGEAMDRLDPEDTATGLVALPCLDSEAHAQRCQADLAVPREQAARLGRSALEAIERGVYVDRAGRPVDWGEAVTAAVAAKRSLPPDAALPSAPAPSRRETGVQVANETTLVAAKRLTETGERVLALNFANGIAPGGGFLHGARAQEEVLCRSSALYATLRGDPMYDAHRQRTLPDSTDWAILSPDVPVFRSDDGTPLDAHWPLSVITCAAPYAPGVGQPRAGDLLQQRIARVLDIARTHGYTALVLGAWGCGAFGNDPHRTARDFHAALMRHAGAFAQVVFAVADWSPERRFLTPFALSFAPTP